MNYLTPFVVEWSTHSEDIPGNYIHCLLLDLGPRNMEASSQGILMTGIPIATTIQNSEGIRSVLYQICPNITRNQCVDLNKKKDRKDCVITVNQQIWREGNINNYSNNIFIKNLQNGMNSSQRYQCEILYWNFNRILTNNKWITCTWRLCKKINVYIHSLVPKKYFVSAYITH